MSGASSTRARLVAVVRSVLIYSLIIIVASFVGNLWMTRNQATGPAPDLSGPGLGGEVVTIDYRDQGRPLLLYFFADWCPICKFQNASIVSIADDYPVIAVAMQSGDVDNVANYVDSEGLAVKVINDQGGRLSRDFSVNGVPAVFVIDEQGVIRSSLRGYASEWRMRLRLWMISRGWL